MVELKDLLLHFDKLLLSEEIKIKAIINVLKQVINIEIEPKDIKIKSNTIYLNIKPIYKNEIFLQKEKIDSLLEETLGKRYPKNIK